jgi:hypothetical protein
MPQPSAKRSQPQKTAMRATIGYVSLLFGIILFISLKPYFDLPSNEASTPAAVVPAALGADVENLAKPETPPSTNNSKRGKTLDEKRNSAVDVLNGS